MSLRAHPMKRPRKSALLESPTAALRVTLRTDSGRAYGYLAARDNASGQREIHPEQAETVRRIFTWYAAGKSPRWIAGELNRLEVPSPGASWNRTSDRLHAKRKHGWVSTAIHGDRTRGTDILNNPLYVGEVRCNRSTWKRGAADSKQRRWQLNDAAQVVTHQEERLRIVPRPLWDAVKARQQAVEGMTVKLRGALKRGRLPRHLLSGPPDLSAVRRRFPLRKWSGVWLRESSGRRRCGMRQWRARPH